MRVCSVIRACYPPWSRRTRSRSTPTTDAELVFTISSKDCHRVLSEHCTKTRMWVIIYARADVDARIVGHLPYRVTGGSST